MRYNKSFKPLASILFVFIVVTFSFATLDSGDAHGAERPADWATRIEKKCLPNFFKVSDTLYRGAQPTKEGFLELKQMDIKTVINLREYYDDENFIKEMGFTYSQIPISTANPIRGSYQKVLDIVNNPPGFSGEKAWQFQLSNRDRPVQTYFRSCILTPANELSAHVSPREV